MKMTVPQILIPWVTQPMEVEGNSQTIKVQGNLRTMGVGGRAFDLELIRVLLATTKISE